MDDMFNNSMVRSAMKSMTPEQIKAYKKIGEKMFDTIDFEQNELLNTTPSDEEMLSYIRCALRSGLKPQDLDEEEVSFLESMYGEDWLKELGFKKEIVNKPKRNEKCPCNSGKKYKKCCGNI